MSVWLFGPDLVILTPSQTYKGSWKVSSVVIAAIISSVLALSGVVYREINDVGQFNEQRLDKLESKLADLRREYNAVELEHNKLVLEIERRKSREENLIEEIEKLEKRNERLTDNLKELKRKAADVEGFDVDSGEFKLLTREKYE